MKPSSKTGSYYVPISRCVYHFSIYIFVGILWNWFSSFFLLFLLFWIWINENNVQHSTVLIHRNWTHLCVQINKCQTRVFIITFIHPSYQQQKYNRSLNKEPQIIKETNIHFKQLLQKANEVPFNNTYIREKRRQNVGSHEI